MGKPHKQKYFTNLLLGFASVSAGIFLILYASFEKSTVTDWYFWAVIAAAVICLGLFFLLTAIVHKIKADLIKRQKARDQQKSTGEKDDLR
jgi:hypothetical protein